MGKGRGGFPGGMGGLNINALMKEAQKMQADIENTSKDLAGQTFTATTGGEAVKVVVSGDKVIKDIKIKKDVVDPEDVEMLEDLIISCVNEALKKVTAEEQRQMSKFNLPGFM